VDYFERIASERGIACWVSDSAILLEFLGLSLEEQTSDSSTLLKRRRLLNLGTHKAVSGWVVKQPAQEGQAHEAHAASCGRALPKLDPAAGVAGAHGPAGGRPPG